jgi:hypothetical protein
MKNFSVLVSLSLVLSSCASIDGVKKSENCTVWKDQSFWGPYSIEVVEKNATWKGNCKGNILNCDFVKISLDENNTVLSDTNILGKIENNELHFAEKHVLSNIVNYTGVRAYPDLKIVKSSFTGNDKVTIEDTLQYNDKCSPEEAITGAIALGLIGKFQKKI